ncbi:MAG TPA: WYL domain-containing transcriptional regulator [Thermodesulfobacteriota bacterium]|nr:WYL domain-containing transcriptional regulator [Thermodesulfobacteriota bacterium]
MVYIQEAAKRYDRLFTMMEWLSNLRYGVTIEEIAKGTRKSEKTVRRDLEAIEKTLRIKLVKEMGDDRKYRYRMEKQATKFRPLMLSTYEILALYFVRGFAHFKDIPFVQKNLAEVFNKISLSATESRAKTKNDFLERVSNLFILPRELGGRIYNQRSKMEFLERLIDAALDYKVCEVTHGIGKKEKKFRIGPLHFFNYRDAMYILGRNMEASSQNDEDIFINLALHRVKDVKVLENEYFEYPSDFDAGNFFESDIFCFNEDKELIKLKFALHMRDYILEREWFPNQKIQKHKDGSVTLIFESDLNMILLGWIRGFGPDVEVLGPAELREMIIGDLKENLKHYKAKDRKTS